MNCIVQGVDYIRVGGTSSTVHPDIREHTTSVLAMKCTSVEELGLLYEKAVSVECVRTCVYVYTHCPDLPIIVYCTE